jgi:hypothetical protein
LTGRGSESGLYRGLIAAVAALALVLGLAGEAGARERWQGVDVRLGTGRLDLSTAKAGAGANGASRATAAWCGSAASEDRTPNAVAGYPVRWIYAIASDGQDQLASRASSMQADVEAIDAWWRAQDPTRVPRNDLAQFSCGAQLDITSVRLRLSASQLAPIDETFASIAGSLIAQGFESRFTKLAVYYDGPISDDRLCGQAAGDGNGFGVAVVYVQSCPGISSAVVAVHELVHTLGAVPGEAPHNCPPPDAGHTCDVTNDLMYPYVDAVPLASLALDPGRDDYYGHGGAWLDVQDSPWLVQLDRQVPFDLTITGPGAVAADVPGLQCSRSCTTTWNADTELELAATPRPGAKLVRWGGVCSGTLSCRVTVSEGAGVSALFAPSTYRMSVTVAGKGTIRSSRAGIDCRPRCAASFSSYVPLKLTAKPAKGWRFGRWGGACRGTRPVCTVPMTSNTRARAIFVRA